MGKRTLKPRAPTKKTRTKPRKHKTKKGKKGKRKNESSFPKKIIRSVFILLPVWTYKLSVALWHAFDHERKIWIIISRIMIALFIFPFLWLGLIGLYSILVIPAIIYGLLVIYLWGSHKFADKVGVGVFNAANPKNQKVR